MGSEMCIRDSFSINFKVDWDPRSVGYRETMESTHENLANLIRENKGNICIITGAGISAHVLPTFRSSDSKGLWDVVADKSLDKFQFYSQPDVSWKLWASIRDLQKQKFLYPSKAHRVIHYLMKYGYIDTLLTQNIDSLHSFQGDESKIIELHGKVTEFGECEKCNRKTPVDHLKVLQSGKCPKCPVCNSNLRPTVAFFQDLIPKALRQKATKICQTTDLLILIGTHCVVDPVVTLVAEAFQSGATVVEINPDETRISDKCDMKFYEKADEALVAVGNILFPGVDFETKTDVEPIIQ